MQRLSASLPRLRALAQPARQNPAPTMIQSLLSPSPAAAGSITRYYAYGTTSAPKAAEGPSAESGGSRSKDAARDAAEAANNGGGGVAPAEGVDQATAGIDGLSERPAMGRTGGGPPLESSSKNAPPMPKITNSSVPGKASTDDLTEEQHREVEEHNREFDKRHSRAAPAADDKVDKEYWSGGGTKESPGTK